MAIFAEGELLAEATCKDDLQVRYESGRQVQRMVRDYPRKPGARAAKAGSAEKNAGKKST